MRISDWSSDVCSSDLVARAIAEPFINPVASGRRLYLLAKDLLWGAIVVRCLLWGVVGLAALSWSGFARAQERHVGTYSEIIVTGEKARRSLQDTPSSVAVTTARRLEEENLLSLQEVYARTANVPDPFSTDGFTIPGTPAREVMDGAGAAH